MLAAAFSPPLAAPPSAAPPVSFDAVASSSRSALRAAGTAPRSPSVAAPAAESRRGSCPVSRDCSASDMRPLCDP
ncbi:hypothetical protein AB6O49_21365 [Streptomyces sp. SBR177]